MGRRVGEEGPQRDTTNDTNEGKMPEGERGYCGWFVPDFVALSRELTGAIWGEWLGRDAFCAGRR